MAVPAVHPTRGPPSRCRSGHHVPPRRARLRGRLDPLPADEARRTREESRAAQSVKPIAAFPSRITLSPPSNVLSRRMSSSRTDVAADVQRPAAVAARDERQRDPDVHAGAAEVAQEARTFLPQLEGHAEAWSDDELLQALRHVVEGSPEVVRGVEAEPAADMDHAGVARDEPRSRRMPSPPRPRPALHLLLPRRCRPCGQCGSNRGPLSFLPGDGASTALRPGRAPAASGRTRRRPRAGRRPAGSGPSQPCRSRR